VETSARIPVEIEPETQKTADIAAEIIHMHRIFNNIWNKLYARELFADDVRLDERVKIGEDALLNLLLYHRAHRMIHLQDRTYVYRVHNASAMASIRGYSKAHQPMLRGMNEVLLSEGIKGRYFRDFLQSCVWIHEKETGILSCMRLFNQEIRPMVMEKLTIEGILERDKRLFHMVERGYFPAFYILMRVREKLTGRKWGIRR